MSEKIPSAIIGLLSKIFPVYYSHAEIDSLFLTASAPDEIPDCNKNAKVMKWLRLVNKECAEPLTVLGSIMSDFMDDEHYNSAFYYGDVNEYKQKREEAKETIIKTLAKDGLLYSRNGYITKSGALPTLSLQQSVEKHGLKSVEIEINRALKNIEADPSVSLHSACNVLEATLKAYLNHHGVEFNKEKDTISNLWQKVNEHIGILPKQLENKNLKKIASGLYSVIEGTMNLRNKLSAAHGRTEEQHNTNIVRPRHARLVVHASHSLSIYILEFLEAEKSPKP